MTSSPTPLPALRRQLLALSAEQRVEAILASPRSQELVRSLSAQELFLTISEAGLESAGQLLPLASTPQLEFLFDIDAWSGEELSLEPLIAWIRRLDEHGGPELIARMLKAADESFVVLVLAKLLAVYKNDESTEPRFWPPEDRATLTLDDSYFFEPQEGVDEGAFEAIHQGLRRLRTETPLAFAALMEQVLWRLPAEQEELAAEQRRSRLAEKGFVPLSEALEVWSAGPEPLVAKRERLLRSIRDFVPESAGSIAADLPVLAKHAALPLIQALPRLSNQRRELVLTTLVRLGNRFAVASLEPLGELATHRHGLELAIGHANLGLEGLLDAAGGGEPSLLLGAIHPVDLVQYGVGLVASRAYRARRLADGWLRRVPLAQERLDEQWRLSLRGLLDPRPQRLEADGARPYRTLRDLAICDGELAALDELGRFLEAGLGLEPGVDLPELNPLPRERRSPSDLEWSTVILTCWAQEALGQPLRPKPLTEESARKARVAIDLPALAERHGLSSWLPRLEQLVAEQWPAHAIDPRLTRCLLLR